MTKTSFISRVRPLHGQANTTQAANARRLWLCAGQGSQRKGMGQSYYESSPVFKRAIDEANDAFRHDLSLMGQPNTTLMKVMFDGEGLMDRTSRTQVALVSTSVAFQRMLAAEGIEPADGDLVAGHSAGELGAYIIAGGWSLYDGVRAVHWRGFTMEEIFKRDHLLRAGGVFMKALEDERALEKLPDIQRVCDEVMAENADKGWVVSPANMNSPRQVLISGHPVAVAEAAKRLRGIVEAFKDVQVAGPFHSRLVSSKPFKEKLEEFQIRVQPPSLGVISNVTGALLAAGTDPTESLLLQIPSPVKWAQSMAEAQRLGVGQVIPLAVDEGRFARFTSANFKGNDAPAVIDPQDPLFRHSLRAPAGSFRVKPYEPSVEEKTRDLLAYNYDEQAIARRVRELAVAGGESDLAAALQIVENDVYAAQDAGLRELRKVSDAYLFAKVEQAMTDRGLAWPPPQVRDLPKVALPANQGLEALINAFHVAQEKTDFHRASNRIAQAIATKGPQAALESEIYSELSARGIAPLDPEDLTYYVETRWGNKPEKLRSIFKSLQFVMSLNPLKLSRLDYREGGEEKYGIGSWTILTLYLDGKIDFPAPGALSQGDLV